MAHKAKFLHVDDYLNLLTDEEKRTPYYKQVLDRIMQLPQYLWVNQITIVKQGLMLFADKAELNDWLQCQQEGAETTLHAMSGTNSCHGTWKTRHAGQ